LEGTAQTRSFFQGLFTRLFVAAATPSNTLLPGRPENHTKVERSARAAESKGLAAARRGIVHPRDGRLAGSDFQAEKASLGAVPIGVPKEASQVTFK
jgi:hypothetical protein